MNRRGFFGGIAAAFFAPSPAGQLALRRGGAGFGGSSAKPPPKHNFGLEFDLVPGPSGGWVVPVEWRQHVADRMRANYGFESQYVWRMRNTGRC